MPSCRADFRTIYRCPRRCKTFGNLPWVVPASTQAHRLLSELLALQRERNQWTYLEQGTAQGPIDTPSIHLNILKKSCVDMHALHTKLSGKVCRAEANNDGASFIVHDLAKFCFYFFVLFCFSLIGFCCFY